MIYTNSHSYKSGVEIERIRIDREERGTKERKKEREREKEIEKQSKAEQGKAREGWRGELERERE